MNKVVQPAQLHIWIFPKLLQSRNTDIPTNQVHWPSCVSGNIRACKGFIREFQSFSPFGNQLLLNGPARPTLYFTHFYLNHTWLCELQRLEVSVIHSGRFRHWDRTAQLCWLLRFREDRRPVSIWTKTICNHLVLFISKTILDNTCIHKHHKIRNYTFRVVPLIY